MSTVRAVEFSRVASTSDIPPGIMRKVTLDGRDVLLANVDGKYYAIGGVCTHQEGPLDEGILDNFEVECPWHGSRFDLRTGNVRQGPAEDPEAVYEVRVDGDNILIRAR
jgi:glycine betaine catabolism B